MTEQVLLIVNRASGTGTDGSMVKRLNAALSSAAGNRARVKTQVVSDHREARRLTQEFLRASDSPAAVVAGGGGGTLRAVIEGVCEGCAPGCLPGPQHVRVAGLRMGSGNVVAKEFGVALDPVQGIEGIARNLFAGRVAPCCVMCCEIGKAHGSSEMRYAVTMCGLGQFGRTSGDLARWHRRLTNLRRAVARIVGLERLNDFEYASSMFSRLMWSVVWPTSCERVEATTGDDRRSFRLLAGVALNCSIRGVPFVPGVRIQDAALSLHLLPFPGRAGALSALWNRRGLAESAWTVRIQPGECVKIRYADRDCVEFFLDEDPAVAEGWLTIQVAGTLAFVPGAEYSGPVQEVDCP